MTWTWDKWTMNLEDPYASHSVGPTNMISIHLVHIIKGIDSMTVLSMWWSINHLLLRKQTIDELVKTAVKVIVCPATNSSSSTFDIFWICTFLNPLIPALFWIWWSPRRAPSMPGVWHVRWLADFPHTSGLGRLVNHLSRVFLNPLFIPLRTEVYFCQQN
jgi:hypothetical protein